MIDLRSFLRILAAGALALGLAACGGSSDSSPPPPPPPPPPAPVLTTLTASLTGGQENPPTVSGALGTGSLTLSSPTLAVTGGITIEGMTANMAHVHIGDAGANGPIIVPLAETAPGSGVWNVPAGSVLTPEQATAFFNGGLYFNAHSAELPAGEIRGQIGRSVSTARLNGLQEVPPTPSSASGTGWVSLDPATRRIAARIALSGLSPTMAHIHTGAAGVNGPIIVHLAETAPGSNVWAAPADATLTEAQVTALQSGGLYFNAHTAAFPGGEIRGQIARNLRLATLTPAQEVPPNATAASGSGSLLVDPVTRAVFGGITVSGMQATDAHVHLAPEGTNGPIIIPLVDAGNGTWNVPAGRTLTAEQLKAFNQGNLYYNAHSAAFPAGQVRGQLR